MSISYAQCVIFLYSAIDQKIYDNSNTCHKTFAKVKTDIDFHDFIKPMLFNPLMTKDDLLCCTIDILDF